MSIYKTKEEYYSAREQFFKTHPEAVEPKDIECLNLIMKREFAEQILAETKKLEFRAYSDHYIKRLIDPGASEYIRKHINDDEVVTFCNDIRQVKRIHFHNYNNSWFLDVECDYNDVFCVKREDVEYLQKEYGCHDYDSDLEYFESMGIEQRPWIFFFVCGKVLGTNLK